METLTTVREIYKNREQYLGRKVRVGGWVDVYKRQHLIW